MEILRGTNVRQYGTVLKREYKCMNCGKPLVVEQGSGLYSRRFCSYACYDKYMQK